MNPLHPDNASEREDQAALWAAKLDGSSLTSTERHTLDQWLNEHPQNRVLLSQYCQFSADLEQQLPILVASGNVPLVADPEPAPVRSPRRVVWFAGTLAAAAAVAAGIWILRPSHQPEMVATSVAQRRTLNLADGSVVELNARTSVLVDLSGKERHVRLADGEAFFTVAKDKSRPFIVETPAGSVRVTGTVFDVHAETATDLAVTVVEGSVQVNPSSRGSSGPFSLTPNKQLIVGPTSAEVHDLNATELDDALAWRRGEIVFDGTPLGVALARFARYHGKMINVAPDVAKLSVGGRFQIDDLEGFLNGIQSFLPVRVSREESSGAISVTPRPGS